MEVECKVRIDEARAARLVQVLQRVDARHLGSSTQADTYFHHPARDLVAADEAFRMREDGGFELTYKGPRSPGDLKAREEFNLTLAGDPRPLLEALGFRPAARLVKQRDAWSLGGCEVAIDHIEGLGWFVEVEAGEGLNDPAAAIQDILATLGLGDRTKVTDSYLGMALAQGAAAAQRIP